MASGRAQGLPGWPETRGQASQQDLECACAAIVLVLVGECICILVFDVPRAAGPGWFILVLSLSGLPRLGHGKLRASGDEEPRCRCQQSQPAVDSRKSSFLK